jgi:hypothetical protein
MKTMFAVFIFSLGIACLPLTADAQVPTIPQHVRTAIESTLGAKGTYVPSEGAFKVRILQRDILARIAAQHGHADFLPESWAAFGPAVHHQAILTAEMSLLEDEITSVIGAALDSGLQISGLAIQRWVMNCLCSPSICGNLAITTSSHSEFANVSMQSVWFAVADTRNLIGTSRRRYQELLGSMPSRLTRSCPRMGL